MLLGIGLSHIIAAKASVSGSAFLEQFAAMPEGSSAELQGMHEHLAFYINPAKEKSTISKEEFYETVKSTDQGTMLLRSLMAKRKD